jgi:hypothetical protein
MKPDEALLLIGHSIACTLLDAQGPKPMHDVVLMAVNAAVSIEMAN